LYLVRGERDLLLLEVTDERGGGDAGWLEPLDISGILHREEAVFTPVDASTVYVEPRFHRDLVEHGVRLPPHFKPLTGYGQRELLDGSKP
jgi:hypothetical protein